MLSKVTEALRSNGLCHKSKGICIVYSTHIIIQKDNFYSPNVKIYFRFQCNTVDKMLLNDTFLFHISHSLPANT